MDRWELTEPLPEAEPPYNFILSISEERENLVYAYRIFDFEIPLLLLKRVLAPKKETLFFQLIWLCADMDDFVRHY